MLSFEPELAAARDSGTLDPGNAARLIAIERREVVPVSRELRALAWCGVMLMATGAGIVITRHFDQIGPMAMAMAIGGAATACYAFAFWKPAFAGKIREFIVLLGALLISADAGFIESQWHLLGGEWQRHFLFLTVAHAVAAYVFDSRAVLSLSVASLAAFLGIEKREVFSSQVEMAMRAFLCSGTFAGWRVVNRREAFKPVFDHFGTNIAFWGALILTGNRDTRLLGLAMTLLFAALSLVYGFRRRLEPFVIYAVVYALIGLDIVMLDALHVDVLEAGYLLLSTAAAIVALIVAHFRLRSVNS